VRIIGEPIWLLFRFVLAMAVVAPATVRGATTGGGSCRRGSLCGAPSGAGGSCVVAARIGEGMASGPAALSCWDWLQLITRLLLVSVGQGASLAATARRGSLPDPLVAAVMVRPLGKRWLP